LECSENDLVWIGSSSIKAVELRKQGRNRGRASWVGTNPPVGRRFHDCGFARFPVPSPSSSTRRRSSRKQSRRRSAALRDREEDSLPSMSDQELPIPSRGSGPAHSIRSGRRESRLSDPFRRRGQSANGLFTRCVKRQDFELHQRTLDGRQNSRYVDIDALALQNLYEIQL